MIIMFVINLLLVFSAVCTTSYGGTHHGDSACGHQAPYEYRSCQLHYSYNQKMERSNNSETTDTPMGNSEQITPTQNLISEDVSRNTQYHTAPNSDSISLTKKLKSMFFPKEPRQTASPPLPPGCNVPYAPDCDQSHSKTFFDQNSAPSPKTTPGPLPYSPPPTNAILVKPERPPPTLPPLYAMVVPPEHKLPTSLRKNSTKPFVAPTYFPPSTNAILVKPEQPPATIPALFAMTVAPEDEPTSLDQKSTTKPFVAPTYFPPSTKPPPPPLIKPERPLPPLYAMVVPPGHKSPANLDQNSRPFAGPSYLPPLFALRVPQDHQAVEDIIWFPSERTLDNNKSERPYVRPAYLPALPPINTCNTLMLDDLDGEPRPWWHVGIYTKLTDPFKQICGGSIVRPDVVLSAAHCFWADDIGKLPAEDYAVAGDKVYRPWNDPNDRRAQKSDVSEIKLPPRFRGGRTSFQDDLAVVRLGTPLRYTSGLRPICVDFDDAFNSRQLKDGNRGVVAGWGYMDEFGTPAQQLLWIELPYVEIETCLDDAEDTFLKYITSDKICAGEASTSRTLCKGDSGGGLAFWAGEPWYFRPFLRGVGSAAPSANNLECNVHSVPVFTQIASHRSFLLEQVPLLQECQFTPFHPSRV